MAEVDALLVRIEANTALLRSELDKADRAMMSSAGTAETTAKRIDAAISRTLDAQRASMQRLLDQADPTAAAMRKMSETQIEVNKALDFGIISQAEHTKLMASLGGQAGKTGGQLGAMRGMAQQAGYQFTDMATQIGMGQNAFMAIGVQMGQLLGMFGAWGAAAGFAAVAAGTLAAKFFDDAKAADEAAKAAQTYAEAIARVNELTKTATDLTKLKTAADRENALETIRKLHLEETAAFATLSQKVAKIKADRADLGPNIDWSREYHQADTALQESFNRLQELGRQRQDLLKPPAGSGLYNKINAEAIKDAEEYLKDFEDASKKSQSVAEKLSDAIAKQAQQLQFQADQFGRSAREQAIYTALQTNGLSITSKEGEEIARLAGAVYDLTAAKKAADEVQNRLNEREAESWDDAIKLTDARKKLIEATADEVDKARQLYAAMQDGEDAYNRQKIVIEKVNEAKKAGINLSPEEVAAIKANANALVDVQNQTAQYKNTVNELGQFGDQAFSRIGSAMTQMAMEGNDAFSSLRNIGKAVISELTQELMKLAAINPLKNALLGQNNATIGSMGGLFGGVLDWLGGGGGQGYNGASNTAALSSGTDAGFWSNFAGAFAGGTPNAPSGWALVGENGPEIVRFKGGEQVFPTDVSAKMASGQFPSISAPSVPNVTASNSNSANGGVYQHFVIDARGADREGMARLEQRIATMNATIERRAINAVTDAAQRGGSVARAFRGR
ncbi:hypothetical protein [Paramagnetospirillum magneticum]|uniref:Phage-related minor tail protein n=1 Tax=Paramagnetospirillum magneticum (strain ATCC 700264 / AMB-1) TaxID=342108 RepID=Q2W5Z5_PARM1|nr:hypothetical protein [Paramagnetospirillum magneticum]BAE50730.1 Phage-related minor tail protein [Paramagnetospirillum magneticum AMB-1]